jgi:hypothetical protein
MRYRIMLYKNIALFNRQKNHQLNSYKYFIRERDQNLKKPTS